MTFDSKRFALGAATLFVGAGIAAATAGSTQAGSGSSDGPVRCEIAASASGGMVTLAGFVHSSKALAGDYTFSVKSAGRSGGADIQQGGDFEADPGEPALLGQVMLGGSGAIYDATLVVKAGGKTWRCKERVGGKI
jgi:hypothetical protein